VNDEILTGNLRAQNIHCADRFSRHRQCLARTCPFVAGNRRPTPSACASCYSRCNYDLCSARSSVPSRQSGTNACPTPHDPIVQGLPQHNCVHYCACTLPPQPSARASPHGANRRLPPTRLDPSTPPCHLGLAQCPSLPHPSKGWCLNTLLREDTAAALHRCI
jgi:hypothetical protein